MVTKNHSHLRILAMGCQSCLGFCFSKLFVKISQLLLIIRAVNGLMRLLGVNNILSYFCLLWCYFGTTMVLLDWVCPSVRTSLSLSALICFPTPMLGQP